MRNAIVNVILICVMCTYGYYEVMRFRRAKIIGDFQIHKFFRALRTSPCKEKGVRSVEFEGSIVDCQSARHIVQKEYVHWSYAFDIWWYTGWWSDMRSKIIDNPLILTIVVVVIIGFAFNALVQDRMNTRMVSAMQNVKQLDCDNDYRPKRNRAFQPSFRKTLY